MDCAELEHLDLIRRLLRRSVHVSSLLTLTLAHLHRLYSCSVSSCASKAPKASGALQDADAHSDDVRTARSVLKCSPRRGHLLYCPESCPRALWASTLP